MVIELEIGTSTNHIVGCFEKIGRGIETGIGIGAYVRIHDGPERDTIHIGRLQVVDSQVARKIVVCKSPASGRRCSGNSDGIGLEKIFFDRTRTACTATDLCRASGHLVASGGNIGLANKIHGNIGQAGVMPNPEVNAAGGKSGAVAVAVNGEIKNVSAGALAIPGDLTAYKMERGYGQPGSQHEENQEKDRFYFMNAQNPRLKTAK